MLELKGYTYRVEVRFNLTVKALKRFIALSESHYDGLCKSVSKPGPGSFINGWKYIWPNDGCYTTCQDDQTQEVQLDLNDLDILGKICEGESLHFRGDPFRVAPPVWDLLKKGIEESKRVNPRENITPMKVQHVTKGVPQ
jgi:hypothetical protein